MCEECSLCPLGSVGSRQYGHDKDKVWLRGTMDAFDSFVHLTGVWRSLKRWRVLGASRSTDFSDPSVKMTWLHLLSQDGNAKLLHQPIRVRGEGENVGNFPSQDREIMNILLSDVKSIDVLEKRWKISL